MADKEPSGYEILLGIVNTLKCYKTLQKDLLVEIDIRNRTEIVHVRSSDFKSWCYHQLNERDETIGVEAYNNIVERLAAKIWAMDEEIEIHTRVAGNEKAIYVDLTDREGKIVKITPKGYKVVFTGDCKRKFIRSPIMQEQAEPQLNPDVGIKDIKRYFNITSEDSFNLLLVYIISCFVPKIPHPILLITGSQGAAKTTASKLIKRIVDPSYVDVISFPKEKRDLIVQLNRGHMLFFDNVDGIKDDFNDVLCQTSTGGYQIARKLYTDNEIVAYRLQKCMILNGIMSISEKADLLDRSISIKFERIADTSRMSEKQVFSEFEKDLPYFLGSAFDVLSKAMEIHSTVKLARLPRMADFAQWGYSIAEVLGIGGNNFLKSYERNRNEIGLALIQSNATAKGILDFMEQTEKGQWKGSVKEFWRDLEKFALRTNINRDDKTWARSENVLGKKLEEMKVSLEEQGVHFDKRNIGKNKELTIKYTKKQ